MASCGKGTLYTILPLVWELFLKKHFFSASLIILEIACNIFATFYPECLSRYLNPIHMFGAKMLVWEKENKSLFENEVKKPKNTHSNASVLHMTNIKINFHKKIFEWIEASKTGPPQILCEIDINKEDAP